LQQRLLLALRKEKRAFKLQELAAEVQEDQNYIAEALWGLISDGKIDFSHKNREALYAVSRQ